MAATQRTVLGTTGAATRRDRRVEHGARLTVFEYARPTALEEALRLLGGVPDARPLLGGTDLIVGLRKGKLRPSLVVDLKRVPQLAPSIELRDQRLRVSAATPMTQLIGDEHVRRHFPALIEAALTVGSIQIRNRATLAGNICNASPAADTAPPLLVYGARIEISGRAGTRHLAVDEFLVGPGRTSLEPGELVSAIELPVPDEPLGAGFARMTRRRGVDLATVNVCCSVSASGVARFAYGAAGPRPFLASDASGALADPALAAQEQDRLLRQLTGQATPISNVRASREYRQAMLLVLSRRVLERARRQLAGEEGHGG